jgi:hypothetical protein
MGANLPRTKTEGIRYQEIGIMSTHYDPLRESYLVGPHDTPDMSAWRTADTRAAIR